MHYFDFVFAYQESIDSKLITSKHRLINYFIDKEYKILYIEIPVFFPIWILKKFINLIYYKKIKYEHSKNKKLQIIKPFTLIPTKFFFDNKLIAKFEAFTIKTYIKFVLKTKSINSKNFFIYIPKAIDLYCERFISTKNIYYHLIDDFRFLKRAPKIINYYHKITLSLSSKIFTPSYYMAEKINKENVHILPHGYINYKFKKNNYDISNIVSQKFNNIIYYGQLNKLNYNLVNEVIYKLRNHNFIFIGNLQDSNINKQENVKSINFMPHNHLMYLVKNCQLLWCPFKINNLTGSMTPIKFVEALSQGIPILSTSINFKDKLISEYIEFKDNPQEHISFIQNFYKNENDKKRLERINIVKERSWDAIIRKYIDLIEIES